jgi:hypothetical protein
MQVWRFLGVVLFIAAALFSGNGQAAWAEASSGIIRTKSGRGTPSGF